MMRGFSLLLSLFVIGLLVGCAEEPATQAPPPKPQVAAPAPATPPPVEETEPVEVEEEDKFVYRTEGRRDPFVPLTQIRKPVGDSGEPMTPLQRFELGQYRLLAVIVGKGEPRAMVQAPDGKTYILKEGLKIGKNGGVIIDINSYVIQVEEKYYDFSGNVRTNIQEIGVPRR